MNAMNVRITTAVLVGAMLVGATAVADAQTRHYRASRGYFDYDSWASRHAPSPADRAGAANFRNLTPPAGGAGRVNSQTQN
jgi:hypothetical protein